MESDLGVRRPTHSLHMTCCMMVTIYCPSLVSAAPTRVIKK